MSNTSIAPIAILALAGFAVGGFFLWRGGGSELLESPPVQRPASIPSSEPAPVVSSLPLVKSTITDAQRRDWAKSRETAFPGENEIPDPDGIGPCPPADVCGRRADSRVQRRGLMRGIPTWWHADGVMTQILAGKQYGKDALFYAVVGPKDPLPIDLRIEDPTSGAGQLPPPGQKTGGR